MVDRIFIVTGGYGHLGSTVVRMLCEKGEKVRCFAMPGDRSQALDGIDVEIVRGDIRNLNDLEKLFCGLEGWHIIVIHTAGIISIASQNDDSMREVNVNGTANVLSICKKYKVKKLIYISSVHALPENESGITIKETDEFSPEHIHGLYGKTKAEATRLVMECACEGLNCVVILPTGICGPGDYGRGHMTQLVIDYMKGRLWAGVRGGYDFVDVRDVAKGIIAAAESEESRGCYILSNRYCSVPEILENLAKLSGKKRIKIFLPLWFAKLTAPAAEIWYRLRKETPLYTRYSLYVLQSNSDFSHGKADRELGYGTRSMKESLNDTIKFLEENKRI
jgi:dihydroflavonol-4-reductase